MSAPLVPGSITATMEVGRCVFVKVLTVTPAAGKNIYGAEYRVKYIGWEKVLLDLGQNWYLSPGDEFITHQINIDTALKQLAA